MRRILTTGWLLGALGALTACGDPEQEAIGENAFVDPDAPPPDTRSNIVENSFPLPWDAEPDAPPGDAAPADAPPTDAPPTDAPPR